MLATNNIYFNTGYSLLVTSCFLLLTSLRYFIFELSLNLGWCRAKDLLKITDCSNQSLVQKGLTVKSIETEFCFEDITHSNKISANSYPWRTSSPDLRCNLWIKSESKHSNCKTVIDILVKVSTQYELQGI